MRIGGSFAAGLLMLAAVAAAAENKPNTLTDKEKAEGWILLFDGTSLDAWRGYRLSGLPKTGWQVSDGVLKTVAKAHGRELITIRKFGDFEFSWEWRIAPAGNNGIKYFVTESRPDAPGHEYQMIDDERNEDRNHGPTWMTGAFYDVLGPTGAEPKPAGEWNASRVIVQGNHVEHWLNGKKVLEYELGSARLKEALAKSKFAEYPDFGTRIRGHIMLTYHNDECSYRNLKIRELPAK